LSTDFRKYLTLGIACAFVNISYEKTEPIEQPSFAQSKPTLFLGREAGDSKTPHDCCMTTGFADVRAGLFSDHQWPVPEQSRAVSEVDSSDIPRGSGLLT
jgi:hypothetical protein